MSLFERIFRNLTVKLIAVVFAIIIPINIIAVAMAVVISNSYTARLGDLYENQLTIYAMSIDRDLETMNRQLNEFLRMDTFTALTLDSQTDSTVRQVRLDNEVKKIRNVSALDGLSYTWDPGKEIIGLFSPKYTTMAMKKEVKELLHQRERSEDIGTYNEIVSLHGDAYIIQHYDFPQFSFGFLFSVKTILEDYAESSGVDGSMLMFAGEDGSVDYVYDSGEKQNEVLAQPSDGGDSQSARMPQLSDYLNNDKYMVLQRDITNFDYTIVQVIPKRVVAEALPVFITWFGILAGISFLALPLLAYFIIRWVIKPLWLLRTGMTQVEQGNLEYRLMEKSSSFQMEYLYSVFNHMVGEIKDLTIESYEKDIERLQTEAINMRLQVNPHMVLNFLNTIYSLAGTASSAQVREFTLLLTEYFRYVLRQDAALVRVKEELDFVLNYLKIQKVRFPNSYVCVYAMDEDAENIRIPRLLIQNFVENCIKYGLVMGDVVEILLNIHTEKDHLTISVCDTGNGISEEKLALINNGEKIEDRNGKHVGIWNCVRRMRLYYGNNFVFKVTSKLGEGTQVWMELPTEVLNPDVQTTDIYELHRKPTKDSRSVDKGV